MDEPFEINIMNPAMRSMLEGIENRPSTQQSRMDDDLFDEPFNLDELRLFKFYSTLQPNNIIVHLKDSELVAKSLIEGLINDCSNILYDKYIESKLDDHVIEKLEDFIDLSQMQQYIDFEKSNFEEFLITDEEPV